MSDISVGKSFGFGKNPDKDNSVYSKIFREYRQFKEKAAKSDMANSPAMKEKELEILVSLVAAAEKEGKIPEAEYYKEIIAKIKSELNPDSDYQIVDFGHIPTLDDIIASFRDEDGKISQRERQVIKTFWKADKKQADMQKYRSFITTFLPSLFKASKGSDGNISDSVMELITRATKHDIHPNIIISMLDNYAVDDSNGSKTIDTAIFPKYKSYLEAGLSPSEALKMLALLNRNFEDKKMIETSVLKMIKNDIPLDKSSEIITNLCVKAENSHKIKVSENAVDSVIKAKRTLAKTRTNDQKETYSPISQLSQSRYYSGDEMIVVEDGKYQTIKPDKNKTSLEYEKDYFKFLSKEENEILVNFSKKYKDSDGEISPDVLRTLVILRGHGVNNEELLSLIDFCLADNKVIRPNLSAVSVLKSAGARSKDIIPILESVPKNDEGIYDNEDIQNACDLTSAVIGGKQVVSLLPMVKGESDVKAMVQDISQYFKDKSHIVTLASLIKKNDKTDHCAVEIIHNLCRMLADEHNLKQEADFVNNAEVIIHAATDETTGFTCDESAGVCSTMLMNNQPMENIVEALNLCKNKDGSFSWEMSEIIWALNLDKMSFDDIKTILNCCRTEDGNVNTKFAQEVLVIRKSGVTYGNLIDAVKKQLNK